MSEAREHLKVLSVSHDPPLASLGSVITIRVKAGVFESYVPEQPETSTNVNAVSYAGDEEGNE